MCFDASNQIKLFYNMIKLTTSVETSKSSEIKSPWHPFFINTTFSIDSNLSIYLNTVMSAVSDTSKVSTSNMPKTLFIQKWSDLIITVHCFHWWYLKENSP